MSTKPDLQLRALVSTVYNIVASFQVLSNLQRTDLRDTQSTIWHRF